MAKLDYPGLTRFKGKIDTKLAGTIAAEYSASATYAVGDFVIYKNNLYKCNTAISTAETWTPDHWDACTAGEEFVRLDNAKAETNGNYGDLKAGMAAELDSDIYAEDKEPYNFRKSGGDVTVGRRMYDKIVGGTVAWNQLVDDSDGTDTKGGVTCAKNGQTISMTGTVTEIPGDRNYYGNVRLQIQKSGHKVLFLLSGNNIEYNAVGISNTGVSVSSKILVCNADTATVYFRFKQSWQVGDTINISEKIGLFDLTAMFGSTIADYIYSLEQSTAGAGVAWFRKLFPAPYYAYDAGSLISVKTSAHITRGFNQWDEEWENGYYWKNSSGKLAKAGSSGSWRSKNPIKAIPGKTYYILTSTATTTYSWFTDEDMNVLGQNSSSGGVISSAVCPVGAVYLFVNQDANTPNQVCINISKTTGTPKNGDYVAYDGHSYPLDSDLELRGIPKLDSNNNLYYDGDVYEPDGKVARRYGIVDMGTLSWVYDGSNTRFYASISNAKAPNYVTIIAEGYETSSVPIGSKDKDKQIAIYGDRVWATDFAYTARDDLKASLSGKYMVYELATPTTETADPFVSPQVVSADGTEEYVDERAVAIPVGHETKYPVDQVAKLDSLPEDFSTLIAPVEKEYTATQNYAIGAYVIVENVLYKATAAITTGETLAVGSNIAATTIMQELLSLTA